MVSNVQNRLAAAFPELDKTAIPSVANVIQTLIKGVNAKYHNNSHISKTDFTFITTFLSTHHALSSNPLKKENFEFALEYAFRIQGKVVPESTDPTRRGADVMCDGHRFSLKTTSTKDNAVPLTVDISKFAESRWLREPLQAENFDQLLEKTKEALTSHLNEYETVLMLQSHKNEIGGKKCTHYMLYELPKTIFSAVNNLTVERFSQMYLVAKARIPVGSNKRPQTVTAPLTVNNTVIGNISLDGSVEKLRFLSISLTACNLLAEWHFE